MEHSGKGSARKLKKDLAKHRKNTEEHKEKHVEVKHSVKGKTKPKDAAQQKVKKVLKEFNTGSLRSGSKKGPHVTNRRQAVAIALSEAKKVKGSTKKK